MLLQSTYFCMQYANNWDILLHHNIVPCTLKLELHPSQFQNVNIVEKMVGAKCFTADLTLLLRPRES